MQRLLLRQLLYSGLQRPDAVMCCDVSYPVVVLPYAVAMAHAIVMPLELGLAEAVSAGQPHPADAAPDTSSPRVLEVTICRPAVGRPQLPEGLLDAPGRGCRPFILLSGCHIKFDYSPACPYNNKVTVPPGRVARGQLPMLRPPVNQKSDYDPEGVGSTPRWRVPADFAAELQCIVLLSG